jgi:RHS repeat-associated protein
MNGFTVKVILASISILGILLFTSISYAQQYAPVNTNYTIPNIQTYAYFFRVHDVTGGGRVFVGDGRDLVQNHSTPGLRTYSVVPCGGNYSINCTASPSHFSVRVYGAPATPSLTIDESKVEIGGIYSVSWGSASGLITAVGGNIFVYRKFNSGDYTLFTSATSADSSTDISHGETGSYTYLVKACNGASYCSSGITKTIVVEEKKEAPIFDIIAQSVATHDLGTQFNVVVGASDPNAGETLSYSITPASSGVTITRLDNNSATISWLPTDIDDLDTRTITYRVTDPTSLYDSESFDITVVDPNRAPTVTSSFTAIEPVFQEDSITVNGRAIDLDNNLTEFKLCYNTLNSTANCSLIETCTVVNADVGIDCSKSWIPPTPTVSTASEKYYIWAQATDVRQLTVKSSVSTITLYPPNAEPQVSITGPDADANFNQGDTITLTADAVDTDGDIKSVQFYANGSLIEPQQDRGCLETTGLTRQFTNNWIVNIPNTYSLTAKAIDCEDEQGKASASVSISVNEITPPLPPSIKQFTENGKEVTASSSGIFNVELNPVTGGSRYRLYQKGALLSGELNSANLSKAISVASGSYQYCASAARVVNGITRWSAIGTNGKCRTIIVKRPKPIEPSFAATDLQQTGAFILRWPENPDTTYYNLVGKHGGIDSQNIWNELQTSSSSLSYPVNTALPGLYTYQLSACNNEGCTAGQQLTVNTLSPYIEKAELSICGTNCLRISGIGFDAGATLTLTRQADNIYLPLASSPVISRESIEVQVGADVIAAVSDLGIRVTVKNPNESNNNLLFSIHSPGTRPRLTDATIALGNDGVIYATSDNQLLAIDASTGEYVSGWPQTLDGVSTATPAINSTSGDIYVGTLNKQLHAFNRGGQQQWKTQLRAPISAGAMLDDTPLIYQGTLAVHENNGAALYAINTEGRIQWQYPISAGIAERPTLYGNGLIYVTSEDAATHMIDRNNLGAYALHWPNTADPIMCNLPICDELYIRGWQPAQDEISNGQLFVVGRLFYAILGRSPGERELTFWAWALLNGASHQEIVDAFLQTPQGLQRFPASMPDSAFLSALYNHLFHGNAPDTIAGLTFDEYVTELYEGATRAEVLLQLTNSMEYGALVDNTLHQVFFYLYDHCILANGCVFQGDSDGDGISDADENANGLDPTNPFDGLLNTPYLEVSTVDEQGQFTLSWNAIEGASQYQIQQAAGTGGFATLGEQPSTNLLALARSPGLYRYQARSCISGQTDFLHCSANYSNTVEVTVGVGLIVTIDYPLAGTEHAPRDPLTVAVSISQDTAVSRVSFVLDSDNTVISSDTLSPFRFTYTKVGAGEHSLEVIVEDVWGGTTVQRRTFTVAELAGNPEPVPLIETASALPADNLSDVIGLTAGQFRVDESGAANYSIPLSLPTGIAGVTPQLALSYHSSAGNGSMGIGWNISGLSGISRCRQTLEQDGHNAPLTLTNDDRFCLDGQKLIAVSGGYAGDGTEYRTEIESKTRVYSYGIDAPDYFMVQREDGSTTWYGAQDFAGAARADAVQFISATPFAWLINSSTDNMGNPIEYFYQTDPVDLVSENEIVIERIRYSDNTIDFNYAGTPRVNASRQYLSGQSFRAASLLDNIVIGNHDSTAVRSYVLNYQGQTAGQFDRIEAIYECDGATVASNTNCLPATRFEWVDAPQFGTFSGGGSVDLVDDKTLALSLPFDLDSNGLSDMVYVTKSGQNYTLYVAYNQDGELSEPKAFNSFTLADGIDLRLIPIDLNGDGVIELIFNQTSGNTTDWRYVDVTSQREECRVLNPNNYINFCSWVDVNHTVHDLGLSYTQTGENLVIMDVNTDAYPDLVYYHDGEMQVSLNNHAGFDASVPIDVTLYNDADVLIDTSIHALPKNLPAYDFNGDGVADLLVKMLDVHPDFSGTGSTISTIYWVAYQLLEEQGQFYLTPIAKVPNSQVTADLEIEDKTHVSDLNGDGLADVLYRNNDDTSQWRIYYSTGQGFSEQVLVNINSDAGSAKAEDIINIQFADVTYDGRTDVVFFNKSGTGNSWEYLAQTDEGFAEAHVLLTVAGFDKNRDQVLLADWDGDGIVGATTINHVDQTLRYRKDGIIRPQPVNRIKSIENGFGIQTVIDYGLMTHPDVYAKGQQAEKMREYGRCQIADPGDIYPNDCAPVFDLIAPSFLVANVTTDAPGYTADASTQLQGANGKVSVEYYYQNLRVQSRGRGSLGFEFISTYDPQKDVTTTTQYHQDWPFVGMPRQTVSYLGERQADDLRYDSTTMLNASSVANEVRLSYASNTVAYELLGTRPFPYIKQSEDYSYRVNSADLSLTELASRTVMSNVWDISNGYPLLVSNQVSVTDTDTLDVQSKITTNTFEQENSANWWINRVTGTHVNHTQSGKDAVTRKSEFSYRADNGLLHFSIVEPNGECDEYLKTEYGYDTNGNSTSTALSSKDGCGASQAFSRTNTLDYDGDGRYVTSQSNAYFTQQSVVSVNAQGQPTEVKDANDISGYSQYGRFGQLYHSYNKTGGWQKVSRRWADDNTAPSIQEPYHFVQITTSATGAPQWAYFDKMGRQVASVTEDINSSRIFTYNRYDRLGKIVASSLPRLGSSLTLSDDFALTTYDRFDRPVSTTAVGGTSSRISYVRNESHTSTRFMHDGSLVSQNRVETHNAFGQSTMVTDNIEGEISFAYDVLGNLETVTNHTDTSVILTKHDKLGRKVEMDDPSKGSDWTYTYNALGELLTQTDAKVQLTTNNYDDVGRQTSRVLGGRTVTWNFIGHLLDTQSHSEGSESSQTTYQYDGFGRIKQVDKSLNGQTFTQRTTYDEHGRVFQQFDASGGDRGIRYHYRNGYVYALQEARDGSEGVFYQRNNYMDGFGNVTHISQGNGVQTEKAYDYDTGFLNKTVASRHGITIQNAEYNFDGMGNLTQRQRHTLKADTTTLVNGNQHNVQNQTFDYDGLNRLTHVNNQQQLAYQANGNIDWKFDALNGNRGYYCYDGSSPHGVSGLRSSASCGAVNDYQYDANGNMTTGRTGNIIYGVFDKPTGIQSATATTDFAYGADRSRYKRVDVEAGITTTTYYAGNVEVVSKSDSSVITFRRNLPGAIALYRDNGTSEINYLHTDHLGSMDTITNEEGLIKQKIYFDPWGKKVVLAPGMMLDVLQLAGTQLTVAQVLDISPRGFTGHEGVDHADIIHMNGRIYDPLLGRFLQADPHIQGPKNSQSYNRYSYVLNNPLSYTDPSGYFSLRKWVGVIVALVGTYICGPECGQAGYALIGATSGAANAAANGGNIFRGALIGAFSAAAFYQVGQSFRVMAANNSASAVTYEFGGNMLTSGQITGQIASHAVVGGVISTLQGGKFGNGFFAAGVTKGIGGKYLPSGSNLSSSEIAKGTVVSAVIGGTASVISGGKFANGAQTGAFQYVFNQVSRAYYSEKPILSFLDRVSNKWNPEYLAAFKTKYPYEYKLFKEFGSTIETENWTNASIWDDTVIYEFKDFAISKAASYSHNYLNTYAVDYAVGLTGSPLGIPWAVYSINGTVSVLNNQQEAFIIRDKGPQFLIND